MPEVSGYKCGQCGALVPEHQVDEEEVLYECDSCGPFKRSETDNGNHQCPQCKKFGSKATDGDGPLCPECEEGSLDMDTPVSLWQCGSCGATYRKRKQKCPECNRRKAKGEEDHRLRTTRAEPPFLFGGTHEDDLPQADTPAGVLAMDRLPHTVKVGAFVYRRQSGYQKAAGDLFGEPEPRASKRTGGPGLLDCSYTLDHYYATLPDGTEVDLYKQPGPYQDIQKSEDKAVRRLRGFHLFWRAEGLTLVPWGWSWGATVGHADEPPEDMVTL